MTDELHRETRMEDKVSFREKMAFGVGTLPVFFAIAGVGSFAIPVYQMTLKVNPFLFGVALAIPRFLDAFFDTMMGRISDNTHSRWGRRRPYIVCGAFIQACFFGLIWMVPSTWNSPEIVTYLIVSQILFYIGFTIYSVPYSSLGYEMTPDYNERTSVWSFATFFNKAGEFGYNWIFPLTTLAIFSSPMQGVRVVGWVIAIVVFCTLGVVPGLFVKERYFKKAVKQEKVRIWPALKAASSNRALMLLLGLTILQIGAGMLASNIDYYLIVYYMFDGHIAQGSYWKALLSTSYAVLGIAWIFPVSWLAKRYGKHIALGISFVLVLLGAAGKWYLFTPGHPWKILFDCVLCGPVWVAIYALTPSMLADICDEDELNHGFRREGIFGALYSWIQKTGYSFGFLGAMSVLTLTGFDNSTPGGVPTDHAILSMRLVLTLSTAFWAIAALVMLYFYPLSRKRAYEIRDALEARRGKV
ncbi:MAG TPA: MFS transporter [Lacunisphaera sp.]|jgi:GPH family glycoside/pentoside/hexuronide:cation symporter